MLALDEVQDPHNLGAVSAWPRRPAARESCSPSAASAEVTPAVCRASAGAVEHLPVARVRNLADWLGSAKEHENTWVYGASAEAAVPYDRARLPRAGGSRARERGPRPPTARGETCDELVALPNSGQVGSLNVSTAAAALVYGILHFRK